MRKSPLLTAMAALVLALARLHAAEQPASPAAFRAWAPTPPMGWNSWDAFATTVTEAQTKAQADYMATHLKAHGWDYIVVDIQWYEPAATGYDYRKGAPLKMDAHGRLLPAENRFPSAADGRGFKPLADYVHGLGLKFGVHLMRGIPRQAVEKNLPVLGTDLRAADIADPQSVCRWNTDMFGVDMTRPGAQAYYDSVFALFAAWGIDYVKVDDLSAPYHDKEIEAIRRAIDKTGRPIVLSLSPGETPLAAAAHVSNHANLWRISDDFWDRWLALHEQFARLEQWNPHRTAGAWPDADMLPFGVLEMGRRSTRFTPDEQRTLMSLWCIARSPLMHGGDMTKMDDLTLALLTNDEVLAVNQHSMNNRPLFHRDELIAWVADVPGSPDKYLALFNARDRIRHTPEHAAYQSEIVTRAPGAHAEIDLDVTGATAIFLVLDPTPDGVRGDHALWINPRVVLADGREHSLLATPWTHADSLWDSTRTSADKKRPPFRHGGVEVANSISARAASVIEYPLPAGALRFKTTGALNEALGADEGGSVRFRIALDRPSPDRAATGTAIPVALGELGFSGPVNIRDLWSKREFTTPPDQFAPVIPWHGAGLYRISPSR